jgi:hypothetical protein
VPTTYDIVARDQAGHEHVHHYVSQQPLEPGSVFLLADRWWLADRIDDGRVQARRARYRLTLRHPDGRTEPGVLRRYRDGAPGVGHQLSTLEHGAPISWAVVDQRLAHDEAGEPFLESIAERDYAEAESLPDHQLEHALDRQADDSEPARAALARADAAGLSIELVGLEPGQAPDWDEADRFVDSLALEEIGEDLLELCGVHPGRDPRDGWLATVRQRLRDDLASFRSDVERGHDQIEEWDFGGGRIFAAFGEADDESNPLSSFGWMCRLVDADVLGAAGFQRVRKALLLP